MKDLVATSHPQGFARAVLVFAILISLCGCRDVDHKTRVPSYLVGDWCLIKGTGTGDDFFRLNPDSVEIFSPDEPPSVRDKVEIEEVIVQYERHTTDVRAVLITVRRRAPAQIWMELQRPQRDNLPVDAHVGGYLWDDEGARYVRMPRGGCRAKF